uniref:Palmitoyl-protein thioesterase 1 n=1 Tax=Schistosoma mansoni TaxID=6183 RepID=A0A3Q0KNM1_SCHMA
MSDHGTSYGMGLVAQMIKRAIPGTYVKSISTNSFAKEDVRDTVFRSINEQLDYVCGMIHKDKKLSNGFHMIGISQGGLLVRALAQKCNFSNVGTVVSIGGLQQGIFGIPKCINNGFIPYCLWLNKFLSDIVYTEYIQSRFVPAQYWHDPFKENDYRKYSQFLADINQENRVNETYRENLKKIRRLVLVKFTNDTVVLPSESSWFGFYRTGSSSHIVKLRDSVLYTEDRLGLQVLDKRGDLYLIEKSGEHLDFTNKWFVNNILIRFLK